MNRTRVLLADDHRMFLVGLQRLLEPEFEVVGAVEDGRALLAAAARLQPDVVIADISMPLLNGIEAARQLGNVAGRARLVFLTMHADPLIQNEAFRAGAAGYVLKQAAPDELMNAIRQVLAGQVYGAAALGAERGAHGERNAGALTARQREILQLVAEGKSLKEIAALLHLSVKTVEFHKYRLMEQLGVHTTAELTKAAIRHGLTTA